MHLTASLINDGFKVSYFELRDTDAVLDEAVFHHRGSTWGVLEIFGECFSKELGVYVLQLGRCRKHSEYVRSGLD